MAVHSLHTVTAKVIGVPKVTTPAIPHPAVDVYTEGFETSQGIWGSSSHLTLARSTTVAHSGTYSLRGTTAASGLGNVLLGTITGLTVGYSYTLKGWFYCPLAGSTFSMGISEISVPSNTAPTALNTWEQRTYTFTATATSHTPYITTSAPTGGGITVYVDDFALTRAALPDTPAVIAPDYALDVTGGSLTLDDTYAPYIKGTVTATAPDQASIELITPLSGLRVSITVGESFGSGTDWNAVARSATSRTFNLLLTSREVDKNSGILTIGVSSDERLLQLYGHPVAAPERIYGLSVKAAVTYALGKIGATLAAGADDFTLTSKPLDPVITNLHPNPSANVNSTAWGGSGTSSVTRQTGLSLPQLPGVSTYVRATMTAAAGGLYYVGDAGAGPFVPVVAGSQYTVSGWLRSSVDKTIAPAVQWTNSSHVGSPNTTGSPVNLLANVWTYVSWTTTAPASMAFAGPYWYSTTAWASGQTLDGTGFVFELGGTAHPYFDGSNVANRDANLFTIAWVGAANASSSTLTSLPNTDAMIWQPGTTAYDWVETMLQTANLRLWCDENRVWYLKAAWALTDVLSVSSATSLISATDSISLDEDSQYYDHFTVAYTGNLNPDGSTYTKYDKAESGIYLKGGYAEYDAVYPGPGAATNILARALGKGRVFALESVNNYLATPGQNLIATIPDAPIQSGVVQAITWDLGAKTMTVTSRGLTTTPANAWVLALGAWSAATGTWAGATGTN